MTEGQAIRVGCASTWVCRSLLSGSCNASPSMRPRRVSVPEDGDCVETVGQRWARQPSTLCLPQRARAGRSSSCPYPCAMSSYLGVLPALCELAGLYRHGASTIQRRAAQSERRLDRLSTCTRFRGLRYDTGSPANRKVGQQSQDRKLLRLRAAKSGRRAWLRRRFLQGHVLSATFDMICSSRTQGRTCECRVGENVGVYKPISGPA